MPMEHNEAGFRLACTETLEDMDVKTSRGGR
jgi:hypothetical protein